jgi:RNA ligase (TIGR02306 family)
MGKILYKDEEMKQLGERKMESKLVVVNQIEADEITERDNLAVVARIERLEPIQGKDFVELVHLKDVGFTFICEKIHAVGDLVVYVKYDTVVPDNELFAFMKESKFRVKPKSFTMKDEDGDVIGRIYSQGIVLPLQKVIDFLLTQNTTMYEQLAENVGALEGVDATAYLEIKKYIPPVQGSGSNFGNMQSKGDFPTHIVSKTDEANLAAKIRALDELQGKEVYITQKVEGSSITFFLDDDGELVVCSRNNILTDIESNKFWQAVRKNDIKTKLNYNKNLVCQAELYGEGVQKNKLGIEGVDIAIFNMVDKETRRRYTFREMVRLAELIDLPTVPFVKLIDDFNMSFDDLQELADMQRYSNGETAEGIVVRPVEPFFSKKLQGDWSYKVINRNYKL